MRDLGLLTLAPQETASTFMACWSWLRLLKEEAQSHWEVILLQGCKTSGMKRKKMRQRSF